MTSQPDFFESPTRSETLKVVQSLKDAEQDFEFYPTKPEQIEQITTDFMSVLETHCINGSYSSNVKLLDVGAGDARVLLGLQKSIEANEEHNLTCKLYAIEKASIHTDTYRSKGVTLLGTEFNEVNFISKQCDIAFVNSPYSDFSYWMTTLISQLQFKLLYTIMPARWENDPLIKKAMERRGIKSTKIISESHFEDAHRGAR